MMDTFTVSFFGHRKIEDALTVEKRLESVVHRLLTEKPYVNFLVGRNGIMNRMSQRRNCIF